MGVPNLIHHGSLLCFSPRGYLVIVGESVCAIGSRIASGGCSWIIPNRIDLRLWRSFRSTHKVDATWRHWLQKNIRFFGHFFSTIFDPYVRLAGASGPAYAMLSAHLANVILHHASMSRPFLRLTGLLAVASLEVGFGIYRRYVRIYLSTNLLCALTIPFFFLHIYPFSK